MASKSKVYFFSDEVRITLNNRARLKKVIGDLFRKERRELHRLNYIFCSDKALLEINRRHLGHDFYTDIITFDLSENANQVVGEIYISVDRIRDNAEKHGVSVKSELHRVIFHGALHLCGYKDKSKSDTREMRTMEDKYLKKYI
jgi:probable rRNA maturation factor